MGAVFSEEAVAADVEKVPDVDEAHEATVAAPAQEGGNANRRRTAPVSRRQTHHRSRTGINKRKTIRNRTRE